MIDPFLEQLVKRHDNLLLIIDFLILKILAFDVRFEPTPIDNTVSQTNAPPTELTRSALSEGILHYFNDQLGEAWPVQTHARIDKITSIQRALNILKRALSRYQLSSKGLI